MSPLLEAPWVVPKIFRMDWLHIADLGVAADFIGNFFQVVVQLVPGENLKQRCATLFKEMELYYEAEGISDRYDCLLPTFFQPKDGPYKMKGSASKVRALVSFCLAVGTRDARHQRAHSCCYEACCLPFARGVQCIVCRSP